jgi:hypothetical protein
VYIDALKYKQKKQTNKQTNKQERDDSEQEDGYRKRDSTTCVGCRRLDHASIITTTTTTTIDIG